jgi:hypothetical protein
MVGFLSNDFAGHILPMIRALRGFHEKNVTGKPSSFWCHQTGWWQEPPPMIRIVSACY